MLDSLKNNNLNFKKVDIDLGSLVYEISSGMFANIIEIFRLEGALPPSIMQNPIETLHDKTITNMLRAWARIAGNDYESKLPELTTLPLNITLNGFNNSKISFYNHKEIDFNYFKIDHYLKKGIFTFTNTLKNQIIQTESANAIMYYVINSLCLLSAKPVFSIHHTKKENNMFASWYSLHLPFSYERHDFFKRGVVSVAKKL